MSSRIHLLATLAAATIMTASRGSAQDAADPPELPLASALLIEKLEIYSKDLRSAAEAKITAKREEVRAVLERHLLERTKAGDLDGAIAIRAVLEEWKSDAAAATPPSPEEPQAPAWKPLLGAGADALQDWTYDKGEQVKVSDGVVSLTTIGKKYTPLLYPTVKGNVVIRATVELQHDREIEKEQQAGVGFQLTSMEGETNLGMISCVIQGPEANMIYGAIADDEGTVLAMEKNRSGIGKPTEMQFAFVDGHFIVFVRKRKIHDFHDPRLDAAGVAHAILLGNNSRVEFANVALLVPDHEQIKSLLSGKSIE